MKIAISGASGYIGKQLVKLLRLDTHKLLVIGRDKKKLKNIFPDLEACNYEEMENRISGFDIFINLTTMNNYEKQSFASFKRVNLDLSLWILKKASKAKIEKIINFSSIHCLDKEKKDFYSSSKRELLEAIEKSNLNVTTLLLPAVYGTTFTGKMAFINYLPNTLRNITLPVIKSLKATVNISLIYKVVINITKVNSPKKTICSDDQNKNVIYKLWSKFIDISFVTTVLFLFWWVFLIIAFIIKFSSKSSSLYKQSRLGKNKQKFICYKFRTMALNTPELPTHKVENSSVTKFGKFLRKYKLDELPQILNIIKGEMSLIGPRPCLESQDILIKERIYRNIFKINPGITGLSVIQNIVMDTPIKLSELDEQYYKTRSISLDFIILVRTFLGFGFSDKTKK